MISSPLLLFLLCCVLSADAVKETYSKVRSGIYGDFIVADFGMAVGGVVEVDYNVRPQNASEPSDSYLLLLIMSSAQKDGWYDGLGKSDGYVTNNINTLCNQPATLRQELFGSGSIKLDIDYTVGLDQYSVGLLQCREGYTTNPMWVDMTVNMLNARPESDNYSHFPINQVMEVRLLQGKMIVYALMILGMCGQLYVAG